MKDFALIDFTSGTFPSVTADQSSGPTVRDGAPLDADWLNDIWGAFQALLNKAGVTPSGSNEAWSASDVMDSIRKISGAPGEILFWGGRDADPATHANRLLLLAGQVISVATYPELTTAVYCGDATVLTAESFYKTTDSLGANRSAAGTYLVLPDCRGRFLRALNGTTATVDVNRISNGTEDEPGSLQAEQAGTHIHQGVGWFNSPSTYQLDAVSYWVYNTDPGDSAQAVQDDFLVRTNNLLSTTAFGDARTGLGGYTLTSSDEETRPTNLAFHTMIRY